VCSEFAPRRKTEALPGSAVLGHRDARALAEGLQDELPLISFHGFPEMTLTELPLAAGVSSRVAVTTTS